MAPPSRPRTRRDLSAERRRRLRRRAVPIIALALGAFAVGLLVGALSPSGAERTARKFTDAWERGDYRTMYGLLTPSARKQVSERGFARTYRLAAQTATTRSIHAGRIKDTSAGARVRIAVQTRIFGTVTRALDLPVENDQVAWQPYLAFPGMRQGERLTRRTEAPPRAKILARDGATIVSGPAAARIPEPGPASSIAGGVGPPPTAAERAALYGRGFPPGTRVGTSGLERALQMYVEGRPGGRLLAGRRTLVAVAARAAPPVKSSIDLKIQGAAVQGLAGRFGGIAALDARTAKVRALAGIAFSAPQPPGSTFKIITSTAALQAHLVKPGTTFPVETKATIEGVGLENANGESCGGTFAHSFAVSCNSVFAPLGVRVGAKRLVATAERFGFNQLPRIPGAAASTLPAASQVGGPLAVGSTAIGQGKVLATPLAMASVAQTISAGGVRREPSLLEDAPVPAGKRVTSRRVAATVEKLMIGVVDTGTGTAAAIPGVKVAGKTGTAELRSTVGPTAQNPAPGEQDKNPGSDTDAWFAAYAPARRTKIAVGVLFVKAGAGGATAAPAAKVVLQTALGR